MVLLSHGAQAGVPTAPAYDPGRHVVHAVAPVAPSVALPASHSTQASIPSGWYVPAVHAVQLVRAASDTVPRGHSVHAAASAACSSSLPSARYAR